MGTCQSFSTMMLVSERVNDIHRATHTQIKPLVCRQFSHYLSARHAADVCALLRHRGPCDYSERRLDDAGCNLIQRSSYLELECAWTLSRLLADEVCQAAQFVDAQVHFVHQLHDLHAPSSPTSQHVCTLSTRAMCRNTTHCPAS